MREFRFTPMSDTEISASRGYLQAGEANYKVIAYTTKNSQKGNPMMVVDFHVWDSNGNEGKLMDFFPDLKNMHWKLKNFAESIGHPEYYERGLMSDISEKTGKCMLVAHKYEKDGIMKDGVKIGDYIASDSKQSTEDFKKALDMPNDDILF